MMRSLFKVLRSDPVLVGGAFGRCADRFGWSRVTTRIIGGLLLLGCPYWLGANVRNAWWISILIYVGLGVVTSNTRRQQRRRDCALNRGWLGPDYPGVDRRNTFSGNAAKATTPTTLERPTETPPMQRGVPGTDNGHALNDQGFSDALADLEKRLLRLNQRIQALESTVTDRSFDWDRRLQNGGNAKRYG